MTRTRSTVADVQEHAQQSEERIFAGLTRQALDAANPAPYAEGVTKGVSEALVRRISADKNEPAWMLEHRLRSLEVFREKAMPNWGPDLSALDLDDIIYYARPGIENTDDWKEIPEDVLAPIHAVMAKESERP